MVTTKTSAVYKWSVHILLELIVFTIIRQKYNLNLLKIHVHILLPAGISLHLRNVFAEWNATEPVVYRSFDCLNGLVFMEGEAVVNLPLIQGRVIISG